MTLEINGVWKGFPGKAGASFVLRDVNISIDVGEFVSLIGHSGCGKSTLLNLIAGLLRPDGGHISLDGVLVDGPGPDRAMVFQNYSLLPRLDLFDNVRTAVRATRPGSGKAKIDSVSERYLTAVGLWAHKHKKPHEVSGGMQQRCAVARAFAVEPRVLLLDEPFGALDALTRGRLQVQLVDLWQSGSDTEIVVMVTHGVDEAALLSDRIVVMANPPGPSVQETIDVQLPRPRHGATALNDVRFRVVQGQLLQLLGEGTAA